MFDEILETYFLKSKESFDKIFRHVKEIKCVTYSDSPELILDLFEKWGLSKLEIITGNATADDYREKIKDVNVAEKLEKLKREGKLLIYTSNKIIHSKFYIIKNENKKLPVIIGSPNLTKNAEDGVHQKNYVCIINVEEDGILHNQFLKDYEAHKQYCSLFLEDLTEEIERSADSKQDVIEKWLEGKRSTPEAREIREIQKELADESVKIENSDAIEIIIDLSGFRDSTKKNIKKTLDNEKIESSIRNNKLIVNRGQYNRNIKDIYGIPIMRISNNNVIFAMDEITNIMTAQPDIKGVKKGLENIEEFLRSVDKFGKTGNPEAVKAHMFEVLLYTFYAPFANHQMKIYNKYNAIGDKGFPFLYLYGESNSGKGTFSSFVLGLLSNGKVRKSVPANEAYSARIENLKDVGTSFPLILDDIDKERLRRISGSIRNYWKNWNDSSRFPSLMFVSNDDRPGEWLGRRCKILDFDVRFEDTPQSRMFINKIRNEDNPIFKYFSYIVINEINDEQKMNEDILYPAREAFKKLYDYVGRPIPGYFPDAPAEEKYDIGRDSWRGLYEHDIIEEKIKDKSLKIIFNGGMQSYQVARYYRKLPGNIRADHMGQTIIIKNPELFKNWIGDIKTGNKKIGPMFNKIREALKMK